MNNYRTGKATNELLLNRVSEEELHRIEGLTLAANFKFESTLSLCPLSATLEHLE